MANNKQTTLGRFPHFKMFLFLAVVFSLVLTVSAANTKTNIQQHAASSAIRIVSPTPMPPTPAPRRVSPTPIPLSRCRAAGGSCISAHFCNNANGLRSIGIYDCAAGAFCCR